MHRCSAVMLTKSLLVMAFSLVRLVFGL